MTETLHTIALSNLRGVSASVARRLYEEHGSARAVFESGVLADKNWQESMRRAEVELEFCEKKSVRVLCRHDADYPLRLRQCDDAPLMLFYRGNADLNAQRIISVVGTRHVTEYGKDLCRKFCEDLPALLPDVLIISGLAYGVDIHAHRSALRNGLPTVAVLAHGLDRIYPSLHRDTAKEMLGQGGLLTEHMTQTNPDKGNFVRRNRIVAGMADATVVVESAAKGGALITARLAQDYNRDVFAFPGRVGDQYSEGCNRLIRFNGAGLITSALDFVEAMNWEKIKPKEPVQRELFPDLTPQEEIICRLLLGNDGKPINQIVVESNIPVGMVFSLLCGLELKGVVKQLVGGRYRLLL